MTLRSGFLPVGLALAASGAPALAQDAVQGAMLYMRLANDTRACVSCHGPDPGVNHNNILRAANSPDTLVKVMNTVSAMGFLSSQLTEADRADVTAFLGNVRVPVSALTPAWSNARYRFFAAWAFVKSVIKKGGAV